MSNNKWANFDRAGNNIKKSLFDDNFYNVFAQFSSKVDYLKSSRTYNPNMDKNNFSENHVKNVLFVINTALEISEKKASEYGKNTHTCREQLIYALALIIQFREQNNSHDITFRDADHYFAGRLQEWQTRISGRSLDSDQNPSAILSKISPLVDQVYDHLKKNNYSVATNKEISAAPPGNRYWPSLGVKHFQSYDSMCSEQNKVPIKPGVNEAIRMANKYEFSNNETSREIIKQEDRYVRPKF